MANLIGCVGGTWQNFHRDGPKTNVSRMYNAISAKDYDGVEQKKFYVEGIGTGNIVDRVIGGITGYGIDDKVKKGYSEISNAYEPGDEIAIVSHSRGSTVAASIAAMIYNSGLALNASDDFIDYAYDLYKDKVLKPNSNECKRFRELNGERVPIKVMTFADRVGSLGVPNLIKFLPLDKLINNKYRHFDNILTPTTQNIYHAIAIDEARDVFDYTRLKKSRHAVNQNLMQKLFVGSHGCTGGGNDKTNPLSNYVLTWFVDNLEKHGFKFDHSRLGDLTCDHNTKFDNGITGFYKPLNILGLVKKIDRTFDVNECNLHYSSIKRHEDDKTYRPIGLNPFEILHISMKHDLF